MAWLNCLLAGCVSLIAFAGLALGDEAENEFHSDRVQLVGVASLPGDLSDKSQLTGEIGVGIPQNRFGGVSAMDRIGETDGYLIASDRGPLDGAVDFHCRWHQLRLVVSPGSERTVEVELQSTQELSDGQGGYFTGLSVAVDHAAGDDHIRLDPEGLRLASDGTVWICDEYGPQVLHFDPAGRLLSTIHPTPEMRIKTLAGDHNVERTQNVVGRMPNRGMEGLAVCDDGKTLVAVLQSPLIQDSQASPSGFLTGENCRIVRMDVSGGQREQFAYHLDDHMNGLSEILSIDRDRFLVIERDGTIGAAAAFKKIMLIELTGATNVSRMERLPVQTLPVAITPVSKRVLIDMLDPRFGLSGDDFPEKLEGLAWGPEINGRPSLIVASDNDFQPEHASRFYVFSL